MSQQLQSFEDYWPQYLSEHTKRGTRLLHALGTGGALASLTAAAVKKDARYVALAAALGYGPAWFSHIAIEGNKPTSLSHPLWAARANLKMCQKMLAGEIEEEYDRYLGSETNRQHLLEALEAAESAAAEIDATEAEGPQ
jgi:hypothetical protein